MYGFHLKFQREGRAPFPVSRFPSFVTTPYDDYSAKLRTFAQFRLQRSDRGSSYRYGRTEGGRGAAYEAWYGYCGAGSRKLLGFLAPVLRFGLSGLKVFFRLVG
ncbi:hypothetical protein ES332_D09G165600v1 [Gossypium tomentosum]|uniref:Uncharacterized protein n=1 Tax=Gossypium tomentosum TaxID=34277 RepID=A0A5D2JIP6_GOSTO|nr:hypothetical protein ES332_D09G165600v1 [Gossypium tomentosum]